MEKTYFKAKKSWMKRVLILSMSIDHHRKNNLHQKQLPAGPAQTARRNERSLSCILPPTCLPNMDSKPAFASHHPQTKKDFPLHPCTRCFLDVPPHPQRPDMRATCPPAATTPRCPPRPPRRAQPKRIPTHAAQPHKARGRLTWNMMIITSPVGTGRSLRPLG